MAVILRALGWSLLDERQKAILCSDISEILVYPHTSYWDFFLFLLYGLATPELWSKMVALINAGDYQTYHWILKRLPLYPATPLEQQKLRDSPASDSEEQVSGEQIHDRHGTVAYVSAQLVQRSKPFALLIAPEGTIEKSEWRSGYYAFAKKLQCNVRVVGLDYEKRCIIIKPELIVADRDSTERILKANMESIVSLYPEASLTPCHPIDPPSVIDPRHSLCFMLSFCFILYRFCPRYPWLGYVYLFLLGHCLFSAWKLPNFQRAFYQANGKTRWISVIYATVTFVLIFDLVNVALWRRFLVYLAILEVIFRSATSTTLYITTGTVVPTLPILVTLIALLI